MNFITIFHKKGETTIRLEHIADIRKIDGYESIYYEGEKDGTLINQPDCFYVKIYDHIQQQYFEHYLTEEQYISLLEKLKGKEANERFKKSIEEHIITEQDIKDLTEDFENFASIRKKSFIEKEYFKWVDDKNDLNQTVGEFKNSLIGRDIRSGED